LRQFVQASLLAVCLDVLERLSVDSCRSTISFAAFVGESQNVLAVHLVLLTLEDPHRFGKSRDVGGYLGLQPGRRKSGDSQPQLHISKEGDPYLGTLLVQGAQHILRPFGIDCDLRRWGLKLAERGGRNGKKRAIVATARKLAVLQHRLWVSGEVYEPLHNSGPMSGSRARNNQAKPSQNRSRKRKDKSQSRVPVTAPIAWATFHS